MKNRNKFIAAFILLVMLLTGTLTTTALAEQGPMGYVNLYIHKHVMSNLSGTEEAGDGGVWTPGEGAVPVGGVSFRVTEVRGSGADINDYTAVPGGYSMIVTTSTTAGAAYGIAKVEDLQAAHEDLTPRYYKVEELPSHPLCITRNQPFIITLPMADPQQPGAWLRDVHVYPKSEGSMIEKSVTRYGQMHGTVDENYEITWVLQMPVSDSMSRATTFTISDKLPGGMQRVDYDPQRIILAELLENHDDLSGTPIQDTLHFNVTDQSGTVSFQVTSPFLPDGHDYNYLRISYKTKFTDPSSAAHHASLSGNETKLTYAHPDLFGLLEFTAHQQPKVHIGRIRLAKHSAADPSVKLAGAVFKIAASLSDAQDGRFLKDPADPSDDYAVETDAQGEAVFELLPYNDALAPAEGAAPQHAYHLVEVLAPSGYMLPENPVIEVEPAYIYNQQETEIIAIGSVTVLNNKGFELPATGGAGAIILTLMGAVCVGAGLILLFTTRKKSAVHP
ncbi:MAG: SpaH/EbpB family LPXTG-anchored major pilin [Christensenellales bacterium]|jgi:LPXTG-motif cell wall-anchored protein